MPLWLNRLRSKKLMDAVMPYNDFPILLETWRSCLNDDFDLYNLSGMADSITSYLVGVQERLKQAELDKAAAHAMAVMGISGEMAAKNAPGDRKSVV